MVILVVCILRGTLCIISVEKNTTNHLFQISSLYVHREQRYWTTNAFFLACLSCRRAMLVCELIS